LDLRAEDRKDPADGCVVPPDFYIIQLVTLVERHSRFEGPAETKSRK
jgi:hypothetical protein